MNKGIIKAEDLPEGDKVYLKKDIFGWRVVSPIRNEDGKLNLYNLITGGSRNLVFLIIILIIILSFIWTYSHDINAVKSYYKDISDNPTDFCKKVLEPEIAQEVYNKYYQKLSGDKI